MIQLSEHFNYQRLIRFTLPSVCSVVIGSVYTIVDGFFVSNFVGKTPFTALNLIFPFGMILGAVGNMIGVGGTALVAKTLGEGNRDRANRLVTFFTLVTLFSGIFFSVMGQIFLKDIAVMRGATEELIPYCIEYGRILLCGMTAMMMQYLFQGFLVAAEKPHISMYITLAAGITNIVLDALFVAVFRWGLTGAALATSGSFCIAGFIPALLFIKNKDWPITFVKPVADFKALLQACSNGFSGFLSSVSGSVVGILYNFQLLKYIGPDGVAAYGVIMYVEMIFLAVAFGYTSGISPVISYHYGAKNKNELKSLVKKSLVIIAVSSVMLFALAEILAKPLAMIFTSYDLALMEITVAAFKIYAVNFIVSGFGLFGSTMFAALNNGPIAAVLSFLRLMVYQGGCVIVLPLILDINGIWLAMAAANLLSAITSLIFMKIYRNKYGY